MTTTASSGPRRARGGSDRLPVPTRQRRPGLAALAIALILGGAALSAYLVVSGSNKHDVVFATSQITVGQKITENDLTDDQVAYDPSTGFDPVLYTDIGSLIGKYAKNTIPAGTLMTHAMATSTAPNAACTEVAFSVAEGSYASGIQPGDLVKIVSTPGKGQNGQGGTVNAETTSVVANKAYVTHVQSSSIGQGGGEVLTVLARNTIKPGGDDSDLEVAVANGQGAIQVMRLPNDTSQPDFLAGCQ